LDSWERFDTCRLSLWFAFVNVELDEINGLALKVISCLIKSWSDQLAWTAPGSCEINNDWMFLARLNDMGLPFSSNSNLVNILGCHHHDGASCDVACILGHLTKPS